MTLALGACGSLTTPDYKGESLMMLKGSVEITDSQLSGRLVPAIAFVNANDAHVVDLDVRGDFPSEFTVNVYEPPPVEADSRVQQFGREPGVALGYITAVPEDHESHVRFTHYGPIGGSICPENTQGPCELSWLYPTTDSREGYFETRLCPERPALPADPDDPACTLIDAKGDARLRASLWSHFAGLSQDYMVAHLRQDFPKGSVTAWRLGAGKTGLRKGFHLLERSAAPAPDDAEYERCEVIKRIALDQYNAAHGTHWQVHEPGERCQEGLDPQCPSELPHGEELDELSILTMRAAAELDCPFGTNYQLTPVQNPEAHHIAVRIAKNLVPVGE